MICIIVLAIVTSVSAHQGLEHKHEAKAVTSQLAKTGNGEFTYLASATWGKLKNGEKLGPTHGGIAVDETGQIYVSTDGEQSIFVFKSDGTLVKTMAPEARGIHQLIVRKEEDREYLYGAQLNAYGGKRIERIVKLTLDGKLVLEIPNKNTGVIPGGFNGMTGVAVAPDGSIFASIGYGSNMIHQFDEEGKIIKSFGGRGKEKERFVTPHNLAIDTRFGKPRLLVVDREKRRLVHFDLNGKFIEEYAKNLRRPCAVSFFGGHCAVAELESRVTILDKNGTPVSFLGDNPNKKHWANFQVKPEDQKVGIFSAPHGISFDSKGNLYVQDWNTTGRVTQLKKMK